MCLRIKKKARFLHQNEVNFCATERQNGRQSRFVPHVFAQVAQRKHEIRLAVFHCRPQLQAHLVTWIGFPVVLLLIYLGQYTEK